jgi:hypothetical protein
MNDRMRRLLYRSFDTSLTRRERATLDEALRTDPELRTERDSITSLRTAAPAVAAQSFGPFFAERVMARVAAEAADESAGYASLFAVFRPIALGAGILTAALSPLAVPALVEAVSAQPSLSSIAQQTYSVEVEDVLCLE